MCVHICKQKMNHQQIAKPKGIENKHEHTQAVLLIINDNQKTPTTKHKKRTDKSRTTHTYIHTHVYIYIYLFIYMLYTGIRYTNHRVGQDMQKQTRQIYG